MGSHKNIRLASGDYLGRQSYFVTLCCEGRRQIFSESARCAWLLEVFRSESATRNFAIQAYCIMPDHFHFLAEGLEPSCDLLRFLKSIKIKTSRAHYRQTSQILWQKKFFDHILRPEESLESVAWYIWLNPVRRGLAPTVGVETARLRRRPLQRLAFLLACIFGRGDRARK